MFHREEEKHKNRRAGPLPAFPEKKGSLSMMPLNQARSNTYLKIITIEAGRGLVSQLNHMGLFAGDTVKVIHNNQGPLIVAKGNIRLALGRGMSRQILVEEAALSSRD